METVQVRLARDFDRAELRRIKRLWVRHSIAEDRRGERIWFDRGSLSSASPDQPRGGPE